MKSFASIILDRALDKTLDYSIPEELVSKIVPGQRVEVPLRNSLQKGYVLALKETSEVPNVRPIARILPSDPLPADLFALGVWMAQYYCSSLSSVFQWIVPAPVRKEIQPKTHLFLSLTQSKEETLQAISSLLTKRPLQARILEEFLKETKGLFLQDLLQRIKTSSSPIQQLVQKKLLTARRISPEAHELLEEEYFPSLPKTLTSEQSTCLEKVRNNLSNPHFEAHLIFGVTGSGKTEIYLQAIQQALDLGKGAILLVPEIALTTQTIERFRSRFQEKIGLVHSGKSRGTRHETWKKIQSGEIRLVIGARSAIFSPMPNLGIIIVDEEHDGSYKQSEETPAYHARNVALMRGKIVQCPVLLGSATPSLESFWNAQKGKYTLSILSTRTNQAQLPLVHIVDMKEERNKAKGCTHFSDRLLDGIKKRYELGEQTLLFLNRRGFHSFLFCKQCSHVIKCPHCDVALTFHRSTNLLSCHLCNATLSPFRSCPSCHSQEPLHYKNVGTEHVEKKLKAIFPYLRILRIDRDTTQNKGTHELFFKEFRAGKADVLIGTQMITKGLHFPCVTLVGILNSDGALHIPDFRSSETVFQLLTQVSGRAGRSQLPGEVIVQTFLPSHPIILFGAAQNYAEFFDFEIENRKLFTYPPFSQIVKCFFSSPSEPLTKEWAQRIRIHLIRLLPSHCQFLPVIPSIHSKIKDQYSFFFLIKGPKIAPALTSAIAQIKNELKIPSSIRFFIDVDPIHTL